MLKLLETLCWKVYNRYSHAKEPTNLQKNIVFVNFFNHLSVLIHENVIKFAL